MYETIELDRRGIITVLTINRPEVLNAVNRAVREECIDALRAFNSDPEQRAIVLTGAGDRAFSAGQDLDEASRHGPGDVDAAVDLGRRFFEAIRAVNKPCIAAINGIAAGAGFQAALLCDMRVGHPGVRMGQPEIDAGLPSVIGTRIMNLSLGHLMTVELSLTGRLVGAEEAQRLGMLNRVVPPEQVLPRAIALAEELAAKPPTAFRLTKLAFREATREVFDGALKTGARLQKIAYASGEPQAAMKEFLGKRKKKD
ncbi:MAG: enoyl-CoA hydratase/isomerase family protein [Proteobacteria bacterium]|nr:enoyl-CoA hydratase/isomerase family protein [Pseudomonadota bacterium]